MPGVGQTVLQSGIFRNHRLRLPSERSARCRCRCELIELVIELGDVGDNGPPVQQPHVHHVGGLQQGWYVQLCLSQTESRLAVVEGVVHVKTVELDEVWPEPGDDGAEGEARPPGVGEVRDVDPGVSGGHLAAPLLQGSHSSLKHRDLRRAETCGEVRGVERCWLSDRRTTTEGSQGWAVVDTDRLLCFWLRPDHTQTLRGVALQTLDIQGFTKIFSPLYRACSSENSKVMQLL